MAKRVALLALVALTAFAEGDTEKRWHELGAAAAAAQKRLGLEHSHAELIRRYPAPALSFGLGASCVSVPPGKSTMLSMFGRFSPEGVVTTHGDRVTLTDEKATSTGWRATLTVKPDAAPGIVFFRAVAPVSNLDQNFQVIIGGKHLWTFEIDGVTATATTDFTDCTRAEVSVPIEWKKGDKVLGVRNFHWRRDLDIYVESTAAEKRFIGDAHARYRASAQSKALVENLRREERAAMESEGECERFRSPERESCRKQHWAGVVAARAADDRARLPFESEYLPFGCSNIWLEKKDGRITGTAHGCSGHGSNEALPITGRYTAL